MIVFQGVDGRCCLWVFVGNWSVFRQAEVFAQAVALRRENKELKVMTMVWYVVTTKCIFVILMHLSC